MAKKNGKPISRRRRSFYRDLRLQAVQMLLDGYSANSVADNHGPGNTNLISTRTVKLFITHKFWC